MELDWTESRKSKARQYPNSGRKYTSNPNESSRIYGKQEIPKKTHRGHQGNSEEITKTRMTMSNMFGILDDQDSEDPMPIQSVKKSQIPADKKKKNPISSKPVPKQNIISNSKLVEQTLDDNDIPDFVDIPNDLIVEELNKISGNCQNCKTSHTKIGNRPSCWSCIGDAENNIKKRLPNL